MHQCVYLHGFASGPSSTKAKFFSSQLRELGLNVYVPDLNGLSFSHMTITSQLDICRSVIEHDATADVFLIGSSMGGLLATLLANELTRIKALILLAPGFGLSRRWHELLGPDEFDQWQQLGAIEVFHHAAGCRIPLNYDFIRDAGKYETDRLRVAIPTLVLHGLADSVVPFCESENFQSLNPSLVELHPINSDHALTDCLPELWATALEFLGRQRLLRS